MNFLPVIRECACRAFKRKILLCVFLGIFLVFAVLGICFIKTPAIYAYHINLCDKFVDRVCYSDRSVFLIFIERCAGNLLLVSVALLSGMHVFMLAVPSFVFIYRAYTFGGSLYVFFSVYRLSGALIVFLLYLPIHLLLDAVLIGIIAISVERSACFCFQKNDFLDILRDFAVVGVITALICLLEMLLLLLLFHPIGNLM